MNTYLVGEPIEEQEPVEVYKLGRHRQAQHFPILFPHISPY